MKKNDYRQFITEIEYVGKDKKFSGIVDKIGKSLSLKSADNILKDKKKAYDFMIINLFNKYRIDKSDLCDALDSIWEEVSSGDNKKKLGLKEVGLLSRFGGPLATGLLVSKVATTGVEKVAKMQIVMDNYIKKTTEFCIECGKDYIDEY